MELQQQHHVDADADNDVGNSTLQVSFSANASDGDAAEQRPKYRLIRGSKKAVTITKREYLKTDWCKTEPFQQIIHMVPSLFASLSCSR